MNINDRILFLYEAPEDGGAAAPEVAPEPVEAAPVEQPWSISQSEWEQTQAFLQNAAPILGYVAQQIQQGQQQPDPYVPEGQYPGQQPQQIQIDPFEPATIEQYVQAEVERRVNEMTQNSIAPYSHVLEQVAIREGEETARAAMESLSTEVGSFDQDAALILAAGMVEQGGSPDQALRVAAMYLHEVEDRIRQDERARYQQELAGLAGAPADTPVGGRVAAELDQVPTGPRRYHEAVERALSRRQGAFPVG